MTRKKKKSLLCASAVPNSTEPLKTYTLVHTQCERVLHAEILFLDGLRGQETAVLPVWGRSSRLLHLGEEPISACF